MELRHVCTIIGILVMLGATHVALGTTYYFRVSSGDWGTPGNWDPWGTPGQNDTAVIGENSEGQSFDVLCKVTDARNVGTLRVRPGH